MPSDRGQRCALKPNTRMLHKQTTPMRPRRSGSPDSSARPLADAGSTILPFDYAASFVFTGRPGNVLQDVVNISPDGMFVATAIGYGFEEERERGLRIKPPVEGETNQPVPFVVPGDLTLGDVPIDALMSGFRFNPQLHPVVFRGDGEDGATFSPERIRGLSDQPVSSTIITDANPRTGLFQRLRNREEISFLFSIVDSGTGRELQDEPTHNLASLGRSDGERPFRLLATPLMFQPRSSIRVQVIERSDGARGTLHIVFYGYKIIAGSAACPEPEILRILASRSAAAETARRLDQRVVPFDYVATFPLSGRPQLVHEREIGLSTEGGFVVTSIGYGLLTESGAVRFQWSREEAAAIEAGTYLDLAAIPLRQLPFDALIDGIRINPEMIRLALGANGRLADALPGKLADQIFTRLNRPEDVSFRYSLFDGGRGRELQNQPLHNLAGLGAANGDRPFKRLSRALTFSPRSTLRVVVQEGFGRGTLFMTFQGYKLLGSVGARRAGGAR